jgi:hypothetical protein
MRTSWCQCFYFINGRLQGFMRYGTTVKPKNLTRSDRATSPKAPTVGALRPIHLEFQLLFNILANCCHHPLSRFLRLDEDVITRVYLFI